MNKLNYDSNLRFLLSMLKPCKSFHEMIVQSHRIYRSELHLNKEPIKENIIFNRLQEHKDYKKLTRIWARPVQGLFFKRKKELIISIFSNAPKLVEDLFDKEKITKEDSEKLISNYFKFYHPTSQKSNNQNFNFNTSYYQTNNQFVNINNTQNNVQNNFQNNIITSIDYHKNNKEKEVIKRTSKIKVEISKEEILKKAIDYIKAMSLNIGETIIFSSILFDLEIIQKHKSDTIKNRRKILGNILGKKVSYDNRIKYFDPKLSKNKLKEEKELILLIKDFFIENPFKESINHIDLLIKRIDNIINPKKRNP